MILYINHYSIVKFIIQSFYINNYLYIYIYITFIMCILINKKIKKSNHIY